MEYSDFEILKGAYITNLFFTSAEDFKSATGKSWEYIFDHQKDTDILDSVIYKLNSQALLQSLNIDVRKFAASYLKVCEIWDDKTFWLDLTNLRRRKEFAMHVLMHHLWPDFSEEGHDEYPQIDPIMLALVLYKVIKPIDLSIIDSCRRRRLNPEKERTNLLNMIELISDLRSRLPSELDSIKISYIDNAYVTYKDLASAPIDTCQPAVTHWGMIDSLNRFGATQPDYVQCDLSGIWEDNKRHYWIFPKADGIQKGWIIALRFEYRYPLRNARIFAIQPSAIHNADASSTRWTFYELCGINPKRFCKGSFKEMIEPDTVSLTPIQTNDQLIQFETTNPKLPSWCDWNSFKRLSPDNSCFHEILSISRALSSRIVLEKLGDEFSNPDYWNDTMLAVDKEYIYLFDQWTRAIPTIECDENYNFSYRWTTKKPKHSLFSADISKEKPVYIIPRRPLGSNMDHSMKDAIESADWENPIKILHMSPDGIPRMYFQNFFVSIPLDEKTMKLIGIRKITDPLDFFTDRPTKP